MCTLHDTCVCMCVCVCGTKGLLLLLVDTYVGSSVIFLLLDTESELSSTELSSHGIITEMDEALLAYRSSSCHNELRGSLPSPFFSPLPHSRSFFLSGESERLREIDRLCSPFPVDQVSFLSPDQRN